RPLEGRQEPKKARSVVALSCVTCFGQGRRFSPPAAGPRKSIRWKFPSLSFQALLAFFRPLVRRSTDQHATTGTCEIGQREKYTRLAAMQAEMTPYGEFWGLNLSNNVASHFAVAKMLGKLLK
ncbi:MAG: hypothetical protein ACRCWF_15650, partial [Beijerinckiaceae bacterium]